VIAAIGPKNIALAGELADGVLPAFFNPYSSDVFTKPLADGFTRRSGDLAPSSQFDLIAGCAVIETEDIEGALGFVKPGLALYIGGMGARGKNFYNDLACRYGFEAAAKEIQDLYLDGKKKEAVAAVPDELADATCLVGPRSRIAERFEAWKTSGATVMLIGGRDRSILEFMLELGA
jgi:alkanesulfonate monooxygenase SsuD/methylene tetrahydromethanopterin reductase-like flavin-dependent oxidoreductase (luciferase family)